MALQRFKSRNKKSKLLRRILFYYFPFVDIILFFLFFKSNLNNQSLILLSLFHLFIENITKINNNLFLPPLSGGLAEHKTLSLNI